ncbi:MAG: shikimate dehydrogenase, partial [Mycobacterium sp.]|nr:shikimate dehydrogenase [Mycobacterium sp.]
HPLETPLLRAAAHVGARTVDGLGMLVHQAALQQELWLGVRPDPAVMRAAALRQLGHQ